MAGLAGGGARQHHALSDGLQPIPWSEQTLRERAGTAQSSLRVVAWRGVGRFHLFSLKRANHELFRSWNCLEVLPAAHAELAEQALISDRGVNLVMVESC